MSGQQTKRIAAALMAFLLIASFFVVATIFLVSPHLQSKPASPDVYVGVDAAFGTVEDTKAIIDQVRGYTNFFVVGSTAITNDLNNITEVATYLNGIGQPFLIYSHPAVGLNFSQVQWVQDARQTYAGTFRGFYAYDEPGGHQIDHDYTYMCVQQAANYSEAAATYVRNLTLFLSGVKVGWEAPDLPTVTSDYALYEYDYRAGYSAVLTEFVGNQSRQLSVALCRGAATVHGSDWGVMITGNKTAGNVKSGQQLYEDMVYAYNSGGKYILVFDYPTLAGGILRQEHFDAMQRFWQYMQAHQRLSSGASDRVAYVLPADYGYGFRSDADKVWGLWEADGTSATVWNQANSLLQEYGNRLDIVYEDSANLASAGYSQIIHWNIPPEA